MFNFFKSRWKLDSNTIARSLCEHLVDEDINSNFKNNFIKIEGKLTDQFEHKAFIYRLAIVLSSLLMYEKKNPKFEAVREQVEKEVFNTEAGRSHFAEVEEAMVSFAELINTKEDSFRLRWATSWLAEIGIEEPNPARLALFAIMWKNEYQMVLNILQRDI